tara:strand:+ start:65478 stop:66017 length:540 start_codon:yes stop_codon:yes gene_type:complete
LKKTVNFLLKKLKIICLIIPVITFFGCSSEDECTKTITLQQVYLVGNQYYYNDIEQEVPCNFPEPEDPEVIDPPLLENFSYEILSFNYEPDTGNNSSLLQFEIQLNNNNDFDVNGIPYFTVFTNIEFSTANYVNDASNSCLEIPANSNCIFTYNVEEPITSVGVSDNFEILNVEYIITN